MFLLFAVALESLIMSVLRMHLFYFFDSFFFFTVLGTLYVSTKSTVTNQITPKYKIRNTTTEKVIMSIVQTHNFVQNLANMNCCYYYYCYPLFLDSCIHKKNTYKTKTNTTQILLFCIHCI